MNQLIKPIFSFGAASGIITVLGLTVGLAESGASRSIIIAGILIVAFADAFADTLGVYTSSLRQDWSNKQLWQSAISIFFIKLIVSSTFLLPMIIAPIEIGMIISIIWAVLLLSILSYYMAIYENIKPWKKIITHVGAALATILITFYIGRVINNRLN